MLVREMKKICAKITTLLYRNYNTHGPANAEIRKGAGITKARILETDAPTWTSHRGPSAKR